jgi:site-specific recombinase XerD
MQNFPPEILTPDEVDAIIGGCSPAAPTGIRNRALLMLLYRSGVRISEAVGAPAQPERRFRGRDGAMRMQAARDAIPPLKVSGVNLPQHTVRVLHGKGDKATTRGFHPSATDTLARWLDTRKAKGIRGPMFSTLDGEPLHAQYVRQLLKRLADQAGVDKRVHPHGFRHTFAWELEQAGVPITVISDLLGHSSVAVTARYLKHLTNNQAVSVLAAVELPAVSA